MAAMHAQHIAHRDVKLENVMLGGCNNTTVKLVDFGTAKDISPARLAEWKHFNPAQPALNCKALVGTLKYVAPEVLQAGEHDMYDGRKADIWALGVLLFVCVAGQYPYDVGGEMHGGKIMLTTPCSRPTERMHMHVGRTSVASMEL